ncbi:hypothetical protein CTM50_03675 [Prevotella intermedia]|uniref:Uncharacterized protein n=1 Tax=Prevotella intermedia TaxID=28131 RepID=A0A2D3NBZ4_PREIN|nr:hypothetical protein CTM50_03675 [Prevotella intermedia]
MQRKSTFNLPSAAISYAKVVPASAKKVYFQFAECSYILCKGSAKFAIGKIYLLQNTAQNECKDL